MKLTIEKQNKEVNNKKNTLEYIARTTSPNNLSEGVNRISEILINRRKPAFKVGHGSSHIWISNMKNERIAIIEM